MTPLGQQIARLLAPEHWEEWTARCDVLQHRQTSLRLVVSFADVYVCAGHLGMIDRTRLWPAARRLLRHIRKLARDQEVENLSQKLMTAEERAIEELLR